MNSAASVAAATSVNIDAADSSDDDVPLGASLDRSQPRPPQSSNARMPHASKLDARVPHFATPKALQHAPLSRAKAPPPSASTPVGEHALTSACAVSKPSSKLASKPGASSSRPLSSSSKAAEPPPLGEVTALLLQIEDELPIERVTDYFQGELKHWRKEVPAKPADAPLPPWHDPHPSHICPLALMTGWQGSECRRHLQAGAHVADVVAAFAKGRLRSVASRVAQGR